MSPCRRGVRRWWPPRRMGAWICGTSTSGTVRRTSLPSPRLWGSYHPNRISETPHPPAPFLLPIVSPSLLDPNSSCSVVQHPNPLNHEPMPLTVILQHTIYFPRGTTPCSPRLLPWQPPKQTPPSGFRCEARPSLQVMPCRWV